MQRTDSELQRWSLSDPAMFPSQQPPTTRSSPHEEKLIHFRPTSHSHTDSVYLFAIVSSDCNHSQSQPA